MKMQPNEVVDALVKGFGGYKRALEQHKPAGVDRPYCAPTGYCLASIGEPGTWGHTEVTDGYGATVTFLHVYRATLTQPNRDLKVDYPDKSSALEALAEIKRLLELGAAHKPYHSAMVAEAVLVDIKTAMRRTDVADITLSLEEKEILTDEYLCWALNSRSAASGQGIASNLPEEEVEAAVNGGFSYYAVQAMLKAIEKGKKDDLLDTIERGKKAEEQLRQEEAKHE